MILYDKVIIGAGIFGLYVAKKSLEKGEKVLVLEYDDMPFKRASWINQARVHNGYHYPRSYSTAKKSAYYFDKFVHDFSFAILQDFTKIYAISNRYSYTNAEQFYKFCEATMIPCESIRCSKYFKENLCDGVFEALEYTFDAKIIGEHMLKELQMFPGFTIQYNARIKQIKKCHDTWMIYTKQSNIETPYIINTTYASLNQILAMADLEPFMMTYELCEIILCKVSNNIKNVGITVMDGPFFSLMPFGKTGYHSLTSVSNTPHLSSTAKLPTFICQTKNSDCSTFQLANCNDCAYKPNSAFQHMYKLAKSFLRDDISINYEKSLFAMKTILNTSIVDDSRPTIIKVSSESPRFLSVFSGKINTIYDLDEVL